MTLSQYTREFKTNILLATPVIMGMLGHILVGLADDIMVGALGPIELAATSLGIQYNKDDTSFVWEI